MYMLSNPMAGRCFVNALLEVPRFGMCLYPSRPDPAQGAGAGLANKFPKTRSAMSKPNLPRTQLTLWYQGLTLSAHKLW